MRLLLRAFQDCGRWKTQHRTDACILPRDRNRLVRAACLGDSLASEFVSNASSTILFRETADALRSYLLFLEMDTKSCFVDRYETCVS